MTDDVSFHRWAEERYSWRGVAQRLLNCQDQIGLNVNILLWCAWCAEFFGEPSEITLRKAVEMSECWSRDVTRPLRAARRALKEPHQATREGVLALRQTVLSAELEAERVEQTMLEKLARNALAPSFDFREAPKTARRNVDRYAGLVGVARRPGFSPLLLDELMAHIFPYTEDRRHLEA